MAISWNASGQTLPDSDYEARLGVDDSIEGRPMLVFGYFKDGVEVGTICRTWHVAAPDKVAGDLPGLDGTYFVVKPDGTISST